MDNHTLDKLQFDHIRAQLAGHCATALGRTLALRIQPSRRPEQVRLWLDQVSQMRAVEDDHGYPPLAGMRDVREAVQSAVRPQALSGENLAEIQQTLEATGPLRRWVETIASQAPLLGQFEARIDDLTPLAARIFEAVDPRGQVLDQASERLASIRRAIAEDARRIRGVFDRLLKQRRYLGMLQYASTTFHNDRLVLPLKAEHRGRIPGIIHRSSDSGATLFIEPAPAVELNNAIIKLRVREQEEVGRILSALARLVHEQEEPILRTLQAAGVIDVIAAKARYARKRGALCPAISSGRLLELHGARHPVLIDLFEQEATAGGTRREVVPIDLRLGDDFDVLVITGPNTGGKTVCLKTTGLLALMTQAGIPIPVDPGSTLPIYSQIFIDVGDEQSLEQSLSTFSAHLANTLGILDRVDAGSLVLMDELGAGTDPDEGSAIGRAILNELLTRRCSAVVTTHLSQLKAVAYQLERVDNACAEFDVESLRPTYRLRLGEPGNSQAIAIAQRLGMPARLVQQARAHLADQARALTRAIEGTLLTRRRAEEARKAAAVERLEAQRSREAYDRKVRDLEAEELTRRQWSVWVDGLQPGAWVYVRSFDKCARVVRMKLHRQSAVVSDGSLDLEVPLIELEQPKDDQLPRNRERG